MPSVSFIRRSCRLIISVIIPLALLAMTGCGDECTTRPCVCNEPPDPPSGPAPADMSYEVSLYPQLSWSASDPDGDDLTFDIYLGTDTALVATDHPDTFYTPSFPMDPAATYYWKVVASDGEEETEGPTWSFESRYGSIGLYADAGGTNCNLYDIPGLLVVYVILLEAPEALGVAFSAPAQGCASNLIHLADSPYFPSVTGNSQTGMEIAFPSCLSGPVPLLEILYFAPGATGTCCYYPALPNPGYPSGRIEIVACSVGTRYGLGLTSVINPVTSCECGMEYIPGNTWQRIVDIME